MINDVLLLAAVVAVVAAVAAWWHAAQGRVTVVADGRLADGDRMRLGASPGATLLLEFTAPGCTPCTAASRVLADVAADRDGVELVLADVGEHLALVWAHGILRAPTTLVVDPDGAVRHRIHGVPQRDRVVGLLEAQLAGRMAGRRVA